jgi:FkbM family methyltransferase
MANIFIDIGSHIGESIEIALKKKYSFDKIYAFEPSSFCQDYLRKYEDPRLVVNHFGVGAKNRKTILYGAGSVGASVYSEKLPFWKTNEQILIVKFSEWFNRHVERNDLVWIKLNAEGIEHEIIDEFKYINYQSIVSLLVSFDIDKIPSLCYKKIDLIRSLKDDLKVPYVERKNGYEVNHWLDTHQTLKSSFTLKNFIIDLLGINIPFNRNLRRIFIRFIPRKLWLYLAIRLGPNRKR